MCGREPYSQIKRISLNSSSTGYHDIPENGQREQGWLLRDGTAKASFNLRGSRAGKEQCRTGTLLARGERSHSSDADNKCQVNCNSS
jgi:hypothetical protein